MDHWGPRVAIHWVWDPIHLPVQYGVPRSPLANSVLVPPPQVVDLVPMEMVQEG